MKVPYLNFNRLFALYKLHILVWFLFIFYEVVIVGLMRGKFTTIGNYAVFYVYYIIMFYFHAHLAMPAAKMKTKHAFWLLPLFIVLEVAAFSLVVLGTADFLSKYGGLTLMLPITWDFKDYVNTAYRCIYFISFSTGYYFLLDYLKARKIAVAREKERLLMIIEKQQIQADLIKSQHAHLKSQINPHFLFNTLNFIYSNTRTTAPEAAEAIMTLSEMMRYAIDEVEDDNQAMLLEEVEQAENLIKLHKIKSDDKLYIHMEYGDEIDNYQFIPFVLITLVENMFKHGDLYQKSQPAVIRLAVQDGKLSIETRNLINPTRKYSSHNIGLDNIKKRLESTYADRAKLETYTDENQHFHVNIEVGLNMI